MPSSINTFSWSPNKTIRIITYSKIFYEQLLESDELAIRATLDLHLRWLNKNAPLKTEQHYAICASQYDELDKLGTMQFTKNARLSPNAYQAVQWMIEGINKGPTPDFEQVLNTLNLVIKTLRRPAWN